MTRRNPPFSTFSENPDAELLPSPYRGEEENGGSNSGPSFWGALEAALVRVAPVQGWPWLLTCSGWNPRRSDRRGADDLVGGMILERET